MSVDSVSRSGTPKSIQNASRLDSWNPAFVATATRHQTISSDFYPSIHPFVPRRGLSGTFKFFQFQSTPQRVEVCTFWDTIYSSCTDVKPGTSSLLIVQYQPAVLKYLGYPLTLSRWTSDIVNTGRNCHWHQRSARYKGSLNVKHSGWAPSFTAWR